MTFTAKPLADGQVAASETTIFTATADATYVKNLKLFNTNVAEQTIFIYLNVAGTSRKIGRYVLGENESARVLDDDEVWLLESGDLIRASSTDASAVNYFLFGVEENT